LPMWRWMLNLDQEYNYLSDNKVLWEILQDF